MKNNTMKRVLAATLSVLTVAAYVPANVGGFLTGGSAIVASASSGYYSDDSAYKQAGNILSINADSVAYVEGLYEITVDANKHVYTKKAGTDIYTLEKDKAYVLRTKAYVNTTDGTSTYLERQEKDLNGDELPDGVYEYKIKTIATTGGSGKTIFNVVTLKDTIQKPTTLTDFPENPVIKQNGQEIVYTAVDDTTTPPTPVNGYVVAQGFPVEISAKPGETHTNQMLSITTQLGTIKGQTKAEDGTLTLTYVPAENESTTVIQWSNYIPTLQLFNDKGTIKATDVGFNKSIENAVVGKYEFKYATFDGTNTYTSASKNDKDQYIADGSQAYASFTAQSTTVNNTQYTFFANETTFTVEKQMDDGTWNSIKDATTTPPTLYGQADTAGAGTWRVTTVINATASNSGATLGEPFKIVTEFTVAAQTITSAKNLAFIAPNDSGTLVEIDPENGVYNVPWQNGDEITPNLYLFLSDTFKSAAKNTTPTAYDVNNPAMSDTDNPSTTNIDEKRRFKEGRDDDADYYVTGTPTASEPGTYTITITPINKDKFNNGEDIVITWQIVNTNNYVAAKKTPTGLSTDPLVDSTNISAEANATATASAITNAQHFNIGYRQATKETIRQNIIKSLDFVGNTDLTIVEYREVDWNTSVQTDPTSGNSYAKATAATPYGDVVDDPSEQAGTYVALVANALKNDGKTSAMVKNNAVFNNGELYPVYFQVTKTRVRIVPDVTEITYGDDVKLSTLYTIIDADTKEKIGVPWAAGCAPQFTLIDKYSEKNVLTAAGSTANLPAGEYTYGIADGVKVLDEANYDVRELLSEDKTDFTVKQRNLSDMSFGDKALPVPLYDKNAVITKLMLAEVANDIEANPAKFEISTTNAGNRTTYDFNISGGTQSAKASDLGKTFTVTLKGVGNFTGTKTVSWIVAGSALSDDVMTYEAEFDASKPRVMAKLNLNEIQDEVVECGFYFSNNGKMNDTPLKKYTIQSPYDSTQTTEIPTSDAQVQARGRLTGGITSGISKKVAFSAKAIETAKAGNGLLTAEIANSSVLKQVYIVPYVKYANGTEAYGTVEKFNYYDMVLNAEGALQVTKTDFVGDGTIGTQGQTYVKVDVTRADKKGYEVERYGIVYNNSDSWNTTGISAKDSKVDSKELATAYTWLNIDYESEKTVKVSEVPAKDLATKIGTNTYIANTTAKDNTSGKDLGYGAKTVFARAFIKIKDAAGNEKVYYSHLADVTYGGYTVNATYGYINDGSMKKSDGTATTRLVDSKNKTQIVFYAPTDATGTYSDDKIGVDIAAEAEYTAADTTTTPATPESTNMTRMSASTGNTTFNVWWTDQKNS